MNLTTRLAIILITAIFLGGAWVAFPYIDIFTGPTYRQRDDLQTIREESWSHVGRRFCIGAGVGTAFCLTAMIIPDSWLKEKKES